MINYEIEALAVQTFGEKAKRWLQKPLSELNGETPIAVAETEDGARKIKTILAKIAWGTPA